MAYIKVSSGAYPLSEAQVRAENPNTVFPNPFNPAGYSWVHPTPKPSFNKITHYVTEGSPELTSPGHYEQRWIVVAYEQAQADANQAAQDAADAELIAQKINALWYAADTYTSSFISGVAIGLLTLGVIQSKPKALAVTAWSSSVWDAYYARKALVTTSSTDDLDFSTFGPMPHTVPELRTELGL